MKFKNMGKSILAMALATSMALSAPMAVFADGGAAANQAATKDSAWVELAVELVGLFNTGNSKQELADELNKWVNTSEYSKIEGLYNIAPKVIAEIEGKLGLGTTSSKELVEIIVADQTVTAAHLTQDKVREVLNKVELELDFNKINSALEKVNQTKGVIKDGAFGFVTYADGNFKVGNAEKLTSFLGVVNSSLVNKITVKNVEDFLVKLSSASADMKTDINNAVVKYDLNVKSTSGGGESEGGGSTGGNAPGGTSAGSDSQAAQKDINEKIVDLDKKDIATATKEIQKSIEKLDAAGAKAMAAPIIKSMADVIKKADTPAKVKEAQEAIVTLVQALVSKVTTQVVEVKDGKATISASKVAEQIKDAQAMIKQLTDEATKSNIQLTKTVKTTLNFELDKTVANVGITIPAGLWKAIDKKANVALKAKGVEIVLEQNTFKEETYTIDIKEVDGVLELTTDATFAQPIAVTFAVDSKVKNYPTVFQVIGDTNKLVGGTYDPATGTIKATLEHFSFYTVKESAPKAFTDISALTWEKKAVNELSARGYLAGMTETTFAPKANTTRAEFAAMLTRVLPVAEAADTMKFTDLKADAWYYKSVATAVSQGWLVGRENNKFDPSAAVTKQEVAAVLSRILEQKGYLQTTGVEEGVNVAAWAKDAVSLYLREVEVEEITKLDMATSATRAELAAMIYELVRK